MFYGVRKKNSDSLALIFTTLLLCILNGIVYKKCINCSVLLQAGGILYRIGSLIWILTMFHKLIYLGDKLPSKDVRAGAWPLHMNILKEKGRGFFSSLQFKVDQKPPKRAGEKTAAK